MLNYSTHYAEVQFYTLLHGRYTQHTYGVPVAMFRTEKVISNKCMVVYSWQSHNVDYIDGSIQIRVSFVVAVCN